MGFFDDLFGDLLGTDSGDAAKYLADKQWEVANRIQVREELLFGMWYYNYRPQEIAFKNKVFNIPKYEANYHRMFNEGLAHSTRGFFRAESDLFRFISVQRGNLSSGMSQAIKYAEAGMGAWVANALMRLEEQRVQSRNQQRREEQYRVISLYHKNYFSTAGAEIAMQAYGQAGQMALKQQSDRSAAMGYYLQQIVGFGGRAGWFGSSDAGNVSTYSQPAMNYSLSGQGANAASDTNYIDIPDFDTSQPQAESAPTTGIQEYDYRDLGGNMSEAP